MRLPMVNLIESLEEVSPNFKDTVQFFVLSHDEANNILDRCKQQLEVAQSRLLELIRRTHFTDDGDEDEVSRLSAIKDVDNFLKEGIRVIEGDF